MSGRHEGYGLFSLHTPFTPPTTEEDRLAWLRLIRSRRVGPATFWRLLAEHGSALAAIAALPGLARDAGLSSYDAYGEEAARAELRAGSRVGARLIFRGATDYPPLLAQLGDPPPVLWSLGQPALAARPTVALVGARNASSLGLRMARALAEGLSAAGVTVVSGLARGIDAAAHQAALAGGTVAVVAGGVDMSWPVENAGLAARIRTEGLILSEQPVGMDPQARHFPQRNRLISGLARATVVVEAAPQSGSLITARAALDQGREVMAVPGHPFDGRAGGSNLLLRDGATLVRGAADVLAALGLAPATTTAPAASSEAAPDAAARPAPVGDGARNRPDPAPQARPATARRRPAQPPAAPYPASASPVASPVASPAAGPDRRPLSRRILDLLSASPVAEDQLLRDLAVSPADAAPDILALELDGHLRRQPGGLLSRI